MTWFGCTLAGTSAFVRVVFECASTRFNLPVTRRDTTSDDATASLCAPTTRRLSVPDRFWSRHGELKELLGGRTTARRGSRCWVWSTQALCARNFRSDGAPRVGGIEVTLFEGELLIGSMPGARKAMICGASHDMPCTATQLTTQWWAVMRRCQASQTTPKFVSKARDPRS